MREADYPVALAYDLKQAFLQVSIREGDRRRFHWLKDLETMQVETLRFTRATTVVETQHLKQAAQATFREGRFQLYIWHSNVLSLKEPPSSEKAAEEHSTTQQEASHSLATPVEETPGQQSTTVLNTSQSFAKHYMGVKMGETKLLGRPWNETVDTIELAFPVPIVKVT